MARLSWKRFVEGQEVDPGKFAHTFWIWGDRVFWGHYEIPGADATSFGWMNEIWACDRAHIYNHYSRIREADYDSFEIINPLFARDKRNVYCVSGICKQCDVTTFKVLDDGKCRYHESPCGYARDRNNVYFHDSGEGNARLLRGADPDGFQVLKHAFATDGRHVFVFGRRISKAKPESFKVLNRFYSLDESRAYYLDFEIIGADLKTFKPITNEYAKDSRRVYWHQWVEKRANPNTFKPSGNA